MRGSSSRCLLPTRNIERGVASDPCTSSKRIGSTRIPDFHEEMDRFQGHIPSLVGRNLNRLRGKRAAWVRVLTGVALIVAWGFLPLPLVGIWMLPVGLALFAHDIPTMRAPIARLLHFTNRKIEKRKSENSRKRTSARDIHERKARRQ